MKKTIYTLILLLVSLTSGAQALPFTAVDYDPVSLAMGGTCLTDTSSPAYAVYGNPAAAPFSGRKLDVAAGYAMWQPSAMKSDVVSAAGTFVLREKIGVSIGMSYGKNPSYDITDASGLVTGAFSPSDLQVRAGVSWRFLPFLSVGADVGYASSTLAEGASYGAVKADVYAMAKFGGLKAAAGVKGLGTAVKSVSGASFNLPVAAVAGVGYELGLGEKSGIDVNVGAEYYMKDGVAVAAGASYSFAEMFTVRAGYRYGGNTVLPSFASVGAGFRIFGAGVDVAYLIAGKSSPMANTLSIGLRWGIR